MLKRFLKKFLSQFHYRFVRSIVYMLQSSEYHIGEYLKWLDRANNFGSIEIRKKLVMTTKSKLLYAKMVGMIVVFGVGAIFGLVFADSLVEYILFALLLLCTPIISAYLIVIPVLFITYVIQKPLEWRMIRNARRALAKHTGLKIAIAGSFGKTTMRNMLATVLSEGKRVATQEKNYNTLIGISRFIQSLKGDEEIVIFELGEYNPGDISKMCKIISPDIGIITGVNEAHLQNFKSVTETAREIFSLTQFLNDKPIYVNAENELAKNFASHIQSPMLNEYTRKGVAVAHVSGVNFNVTSAETDLEGVRFSVTCDDMPIRIESGLLGLHQIGPLSAVVKIAHGLGLTSDQIRAGAAKTSAFEHRLEPKTSPLGIITLDDSYNGNPDGVMAVIDFLAGLKECRRFYVTPGLVELGSATERVHRAIGQKLARSGIEHVILVKNSATPDIEFGLQENNYPGKIIKFATALEAFKALEHLTTTGDVVLLQNDWPDQYA